MSEPFVADADTVVRSLLLWVNQPWPLDEGSSHRIIKSAGWRPAPEGPQFFLTDYFPGNESGYFVIDPEGETASVSLPFGHLLDRSGDPVTEFIFRDVFEHASILLDAQFGSEPSETEEGVTMTTWYPPNGTSVVLGMSKNHLNGHVYSPTLTSLVLDNDEDEEDEW